MSKKTFQDHRREALRLVLLRLLSEQTGRQANSSTLHAGLQYLHIIAERHEVIEALRFLQTHQLLELEQIPGMSGELYGAKLRSRGMDVVQGNLVIDGVQEPSR